MTFKGALIRGAAISRCFGTVSHKCNHRHNHLKNANLRNVCALQSTSVMLFRFISLLLLLSLDLEWKYLDKKKEVTKTQSRQLYLVLSVDLLIVHCQSGDWRGQGSLVELTTPRQCSAATDERRQMSNRAGTDAIRSIEVCHSKWKNQILDQRINSTWELINWLHKWFHSRWWWWSHLDSFAPQHLAGIREGDFWASDVELLPFRSWQKPFVHFAAWDKYN